MQVHIVFDAWTMVWLAACFMFTGSAVAYCVSFLNHADE